MDEDGRRQEGPPRTGRAARRHSAVAVGVDPGLHGGLAAVGVSPREAPRLLAAAPMPCAGAGNSASVDADAVAGFVRRALRRGLSGAVVVESAQPMPRQGVSSSFRYGRMAGGVEAAARTAMGPRHRFERVAPGVWKRGMGLGPDKRAALELATERLGTEAQGLHWPRAGDHGVAEAALVALWWIERRLLG